MERALLIKGAVSSNLKSRKGLLKTLDLNDLGMHVLQPSQGKPPDEKVAGFRGGVRSQWLGRA